MRHVLVPLVSIMFVPMRPVVTDANHPNQVRLQRLDSWVQESPTIRLFVEEVRDTTQAQTDAMPVLLIHGARVSGLASFDLDVPGGSLAGDLAAAGFDVYVMDVRGFGRSSRPPEMNEPRFQHPPLVRSNAAVSDIGAVVETIERRRHAQKVALLGWAAGGSWAGYYASVHPVRVSHLVVLNMLYACGPDHPTLGHGTDLEDRHHPGAFNRAAFGAYTFNTEASLFRAWDHSIPLDDKGQWRDPAIAAAYARAALEGDPTSPSRNPPSFRAPTGPLEDSFETAIGKEPWDAARITAATLIIRSGRDFWSRPEDPSCLAAKLTHAARVQQLLIPDATHFVLLDRPERGRARMLAMIISFLNRTGQ